MQSGKKKKKKLAPGGSLLQEYQQPIGQGLSMAGSMVGALVNPTSTGGGIATGALKGAGAGAAFGPVGMGIGAAVGGVAGLIGSNKAKAAEEEAKRQRTLQNTLQTNSFLTQNAGNTFKKGGNLKSKLKVLKGGELNQISPDAVEVNADNPSQSDSVELQDAYVDNKEIIDNKDRVFSDSILAPSGLTVAREAKKLEKMKNDNPRFSQSNSIVEDRLDNLFKHQELSKADNTAISSPRVPNKNEMKYASEAGDNFSEVYSNILHKQSTNKDLKVAFKKPSFAKGGPDLTGQAIDPATGLPVATGDSAYNYNDVRGQNPNAGLNLQRGITGLATFAPNLVNSVLQKRLKGPAAPRLESLTKLQRVKPDAQLADNARSYSQATNVIKNNTAQGADIASATGSLLAKKFASSNQIYGQNQQMNAQIQGQEAFLNQGVRARNVERDNQYRNDTNDFSNKKVQLTSDNVANLSGKVLQQGRERNQIDRDKLALNVMSKQYGDSNVVLRNFESTLDDYFRKKGLKTGGKLKAKMLPASKKLNTKKMC